MDDDPGWWNGVSFLAFLIPGGVQRTMRRGDGDGLFVLRQLMLSFSTALVVFGIVLPFLGLRADSSLPWLLLLVAVTIVSTVAGRFAERPLDCASDSKLAETFRRRFFVRIAFAESIALFGFVFVFIGASLWIYYLGAAVSLFLFWTRAAPTRSALTREQERLNDAGVGRSLIAALRGNPK